MRQICTSTKPQLDDEIIFREWMTTLGSIIMRRKERLVLVVFLLSQTAIALIIMGKIPACSSLTNYYSIRHNPSHLSNQMFVQHHGHCRLKAPQPPPKTARDHHLLAPAVLMNNDADNEREEENVNERSVKEIQQYLVQKGLRWNQSSLPNMHRVPGCVATVYVVVTIEEKTTNIRNDHYDSSNQQRIILHGNSDAIVSRGLLSTLAELLEHMRLDQVLELDPSNIADALGLKSALSRGRNDGLANMLQIIQKQLLLGPVQSTRTDTQIEAQREVLTSVNFEDVNNNYGNKTEILKSSSSSSERKKTVALLLSGGVDSSVAFRLLLQQDYDVVPFYLKIWLEDELAHLTKCPWEDDIETCREVCEQVGSELQIIGLQEEYHELVMKDTLREASLGRTPNPDILCNSRVKFGCFLEYLEGLPTHFDYIASGHYAQIERTHGGNTEGNNIGRSSGYVGSGDNGITRLYRAPDPVKDQSYFLSALDQSQLRRLLFPIGHLEKKDVRQLAEDFQLPNRNRPDSQGLCFLGKVKFKDFMKINLGKSVGDIVDAATGEIIGQHHGVWYHTVGQRRGIGPYLKPKVTSLGPWYVVAKDPSNNIVYASNKYDDDDLFAQSRSEFHVESLHWISGKEPTYLLNVYGNYQLILKIRHGPNISTGTLTIMDAGDTWDENSKRNEGTIKLDQKDGGLAPGQFVVFYTDKAECIGSGIISEKHWTKFLLQSKCASSSKTL